MICLNCGRRLVEQLAFDQALIHETAEARGDWGWGSSPAVAEQISAILTAMESPEFTVGRGRCMRSLTRGLRKFPLDSLDRRSSSEVYEAVVRAYERVDRLEKAMAGVGTGDSGAMRHGPSPSARWVVGVALRLLPDEDRLVKAEEFAAELHELAESGFAWRRQLGHSLRILFCAIPLRRALVASRRRAIDRG